MLQEVGLDGLTLRAIAAELGVQAPSLYWRFRSKQDLIDEMATQVLADYGRGLGAASDAILWPAWAHRCGVNLRAALLRYRDGARMVAGTPGLHEATDAGLEMFVAAGFARADAALCLKTVGDYTVGFAIGEQASPESRPAGASDDAFERGLQLIIAGCAAGAPTGGKAWIDYRSFKAG